MKLNMGDIFTWDLTFTAEETLQFAELSGIKAGIIWCVMKREG
jgi:hypothetical protein